MAAMLLLVLFAQAASDLALLTHPSRAVREQAIRRLASDGPPSGELVGYLGADDALVAEGVATALRRRRDPSILPRLARLADAAAAGPADRAARVAVETAFARRVPVETLHFAGMRLLPRRLEAAVGAAVRAHLAGLRGLAGLDTPQAYRPLYAGGAAAEAALESRLRDAAAGRYARANALQAYARLAGRRAVPELVVRLEDPEPWVRQEAARLLLRYGDLAALARLAALLDGERTLRGSVRQSAARAVARVRRLEARGAARLDRVVREGHLWETLDAAAALRATHRDVAERALRVRSRALTRNGAAGGLGLRCAMLELRLGPLDAVVRERLGRSREPCVAATVAGPRALEVLQPAAALRRARGADAFLRFSILYTLLRRHDAPAAERVAFAAAALGNESPAARRLGLFMLDGVDAALWRSLRPRVDAHLGHALESVRLAAAALLVPEPAALRVCVDAIYDGDPRAAGKAASLLRRARPDLLKVDPQAPVAERRRLALELARRLEPLGPRKE